MGKKQIAIIGLVVFIATVALTFSSMGNGGRENVGEGLITEEDIGKMCVAAVFPAISRGTERVELVGPPAELPEVPEAEESAPPEQEEAPQTVVDTQSAEAPKPATVNVNYDNPLVIIYHTHATESYQPVSEGNFHTVAEEGSVREVGNVLREELEKLGIEVIHDKTLHDQPSYSQSYSRSLDTATNLMAKYPTAVFIVDLHRDAASYTGNIGRTVLVNGETAAKYSLVVGQGNPNVRALEIYANAINAKAEALYPGFGGKIIDKAYKFNQYISDYHILLEVGNNENNIKEAKVAAKYFAQVLASVIKDVQQ